jgi:hypothetical protein
MGTWKIAAHSVGSNGRLAAGWFPGLLSELREWHACACVKCIWRHHDLYVGLDEYKAMSFVLHFFDQTRSLSMGANVGVFTI